jgi:hypothetical protein
MGCLAAEKQCVGMRQKPLKSLSLAYSSSATIGRSRSDYVRIPVVRITTQGRKGDCDINKIYLTLTLDTKTFLLRVWMRRDSTYRIGISPKMWKRLSGSILSSGALHEHLLLYRESSQVMKTVEVQEPVRSRRVRKTTFPWSRMSSSSSARSSSKLHASRFTLHASRFVLRVKHCYC